MWHIKKKEAVLIAFIEMTIIVSQEYFTHYKFICIVLCAFDFAICELIVNEPAVWFIQFILN